MISQRERKKPPGEVGVKIEKKFERALGKNPCLKAIANIHNGGDVHKLISNAVLNVLESYSCRRAKALYDKYDKTCCVPIGVRNNNNFLSTHLTFFNRARTKKQNAYVFFFEFILNTQKCAPRSWRTRVSRSRDITVSFSFVRRRGRPDGRFVENLSKKKKPRR